LAQKEAPAFDDQHNSGKTENDRKSSWFAFNKEDFVSTINSPLQSLALAVHPSKLSEPSSHISSTFLFPFEKKENKSEKKQIQMKTVFVPNGHF
jgi:hypothetical protein